MDNVIVLSFAGIEQAEEALRGLLRLHRTADVRVEAVVVVERAPDGRIEVHDLAEDLSPRATATAGLIGALIGVVAGPLGLVVGGVTGAAVGSLVDVADAESSDGLLRRFSHRVGPGSAATVAVAYESGPDVVDRLADDLGGAVLRRPRADVEQEIAEAELAAITAEREVQGKRTIGERLRDIRDAALDQR